MNARMKISETVARNFRAKKGPEIHATTGVERDRFPLSLSLFGSSKEEEARITFHSRQPNLRTNKKKKEREYLQKPPAGRFALENI